MDRVSLAMDRRKKGYNCAQAVLCAFSDRTNLSEDDLFRLSEALGGGMGGTQGICGAVSSMIILAGLIKSYGIDKLPESNKAESYKLASELMAKFEEKNQTILCSRLKGENLRSCDGCVEDAVRILEDLFK